MNDEYALYSALSAPSLSALGGCLNRRSETATADSSQSESECEVQAQSKVPPSDACSEREARLACYLRAMGPEMRVDLDLVLALLTHILKQLGAPVSLSATASRVRSNTCDMYAICTFARAASASASCAKPAPAILVFLPSFAEMMQLRERLRKCSSPTTRAGAADDRASASSTTTASSLFKAYVSSSPLSRCFWLSSHF